MPGIWNCQMEEGVDNSIGIVVACRRKTKPKDIKQCYQGEAETIACVTICLGRHPSSLMKNSQFRKGSSDFRIRKAGVSRWHDSDTLPPTAWMGS